MTETGCKLTREIKILSSMCDRDLRLSLPAAMDIFQDTAGIHAAMFGIGPMDLARHGWFWVVSKTKLCVKRLPGLLDEVAASTWVQPAERVSCERDFSITVGDETLVYARSIWAVLDRESNKLVHMDEFYPEMEFNVAPPDDDGFARMSRKFDGCEEIGGYTVRSIDIDNGGHMNNVHYLRAALGCLSCEEQAAMDIREVDMQFIMQCYEGDSVRFKKRTGADGRLELGAINDDDRVVFTASIDCR